MTTGNVVNTGCFAFAVIITLKSQILKKNVFNRYTFKKKRRRCDLLDSTSDESHVS